MRNIGWNEPKINEIANLLWYNFSMDENYLSIGKIINFFGIKGEAKVGYSDERRLKETKVVYMLDDPTKIKLEISSVRFHKNFAIVKFREINDINELMQYKGQRIFISKNEILNNLEKDEFLVDDLIGCSVYNEKDEKIGVVVALSENSSQDLLNIKNGFGKIDLVPFVNEFFPVVDIKNKKIVIKPIEGLLS